MFTKMIAVSFHDVCKAIHYARTLKSYSALCQLHLSKTGRKNIATTHFDGGGLVKKLNGKMGVDQFVIREAKNK